MRLSRLNRTTLRSKNRKKANPIRVLDVSPVPLFRFFNKKEHADAFINGTIRLSTLGACKVLENAKGRDELEGHLELYADKIAINSSEVLNKEGATVMANLPMFSGLKGNISFENTTFSNAFVDRYVLCFSTENSDYIKDNFGKYGVKIKNPGAFFEILYKHLFESNIVDGCISGRVVYNDNKGSIKDASAWQAVGFSKRGELFGEEKEYRLVFSTNLRNIEPRFVNIGNIGHLAVKMY